jgi:hypothetical protein
MQHNAAAIRMPLYAQQLHAPLYGPDAGKTHAEIDPSTGLQHGQNINDL